MFSQPNDVKKGSDMMKKIVLIAVMGAMGLLWGSGDVTIQVINAVKEKSITHEFDKRLVKSGLAIHKVVEGGRYIVTLGTYKDEKSAQAALKKARKIVAAGAFVRYVNRDKMAATSHETAKNTAVSSHETVKAQPSSVQKVEGIEAVVCVTPVNEHVATVEVKPAVTEVKAPVKTAEMAAFEKKELYKNEIAEAISYYKNSPYHRFEPVMLQP